MTEDLALLRTAIREPPGMYLGSRRSGRQQMTFEMLGNAVDLVLAGQATRIEIVLHSWKVAPLPDSAGASRRLAGLSIAASLTMLDPEFGGPTRGRVDDPRAVAAVASILDEQLAASIRKCSRPPVDRSDPAGRAELLESAAFPQKRLWRQHTPYAKSP